MKKLEIDNQSQAFSFYTLTLNKAQPKIRSGYYVVD
jgi:hypothetical protein